MNTDENLGKAPGVMTCMKLGKYNLPSFGWKNNPGKINVRIDSFERFVEVNIEV